MDVPPKPYCAASPSNLMARLAVHSPAPRAVEDAIPHFPRRDSEDPATVTPSPGGARRGRLSSSSSQGLSCDTRIGVTPCAPAEDSPLPETPSVHSVHTGFRTPAGGDDLPEPEQTDSPVTKRSRRVFGGSSERPTIATGIATSYGHEGHSEALAHGGRRQERGRSMTEVYAREDCLVAVHGSSSDLTRAMRTGWDGTDSPLAAPSREGRLSTQLPLPQPESPTADARRGRARDRVRPRPREQADALPSVSDAASALAQATSPKAPAPEIAPPPTALSSTLSASSASASSSSASSSSLSSSSPNALVTLSQAGSDADVATLPAVPIPHSPPRPGLTAVMEEEDSAHGTAWAAAGAAAVVEEQDAAPAAPATPGPALHADLPPDFSPGCPTHDASQRPVLPTVGSSDHHDLKCVDGKTVKDLIDGRYTHVVTRFLIFDCRFPYEYEGGHIKGAISSPDPDPVSSRLFDTPPSEDETVVLLFHCEFSKNRGPKMLRQMREFDRRINSHRYPCLHYPQMFLIHKGYRQVYADVPTICDGTYRPMKAAGYAENCRRSVSSTRSSWYQWKQTNGRRGRHARRAVSAMQRTQSDPADGSASRAGARSVALFAQLNACDDEPEEEPEEGVAFIGFTRRPQPLHRALSDGHFSRRLEMAGVHLGEEGSEDGEKDERVVDLLQRPRK